MKIAIAACPTFPVPPIDYGGTERQLDILARGLAVRGHAVTLLCGPGSECPVRRVMSSSRSVQAEWENVVWLRGHRAEWDVLFDATTFHYASCPAGLPPGSPTVAGMFGDPYRIYPHNEVRNRVYQSQQFAEFCGCPDHPVVGSVIHHDPVSVPIGDGHGGYVVYLGVIRPEKGVYVAATACRRLGMVLKVAGLAQSRWRPYWESFRGVVDFIGPVGGDAKWRLLADAACSVLPVDWCEAGPLTVRESLLVGTPVVACPLGGLLGDVRDGENGVLVSREEFAIGLDKALNTKWDRQAIRRSIISSVDPDQWIEGVLVLLKRAAAGESW